MSEPDIEKIAAFKNVCPYLEAAQRDELAATLGIHGPDLVQRLEGLRNEDELALVLHFLRSCKHLIRFDEGVSRLTGTACPDLLVQLRGGETFLVEAKSSEKDLLKISRGNLERRLKVASDLGFPLYFALKQRGTWGLFSADHVVAQSGKLRLVDDFMRSDFGTKFGNMWYMLPAGIDFRFLYKRGGDGLIQNATYGPLIRFEVHFRGQRVLRATGKEPDMFMALLLIAVTSQSAFVGPKQGRNRGNVTKIVRRLGSNMAVADYHLYLALIHSTSREDGRMYDRTAYLKALQVRDEPVTIDLVHNLFRRLRAGGLPLIRLRDKPASTPSATEPKRLLSRLWRTARRLLCGLEVD